MEYEQAQPDHELFRCLFPDIGKLPRIYVRDAYKVPICHMVTGTPGVGKSIFILFLLNFLQIGDEVCAFISTRNPKTAFSSRMKPSFFFFDPGSKRKGPEENVQAFTVVFASAHGKNLGSLGKSHHVVYHMPVWSLDKLKECKDLYYPTASIDVEGSHKKWGGSARCMFGLEDSQNEKQLDDFLCSKNLEIFRTLNIGTQLLNTENT